MRRSVLLALLVASSSPAVAGGALPQAFRGDWAIDGQPCAPGPADNANIRVTASTIHYVNTRLDILSVTPRGRNIVFAGVRVTYPAGTYDTAVRIALLQRGRLLAIGEREDRSDYVRCVS